jgi:hypothetical protein
MVLMWMVQSSISVTERRFRGDCCVVRYSSRTTPSRPAHRQPDSHNRAGPGWHWGWDTARASTIVGDQPSSVSTSGTLNDHVSIRAFISGFGSLLLSRVDFIVNTPHSSYP